MLRADFEHGDLGMIYEQLASVQLGDEARTRELRRRYLTLLLAALRARPDDEPLPGSAPTGAELTKRWRRWKVPVAVGLDDDVGTGDDKATYVEGFGRLLDRGRGWSPASSRASGKTMSVLARSKCSWIPRPPASEAVGRCARHAPASRPRTRRPY